MLWKGRGNGNGGAALISTVLLWLKLLWSLNHCVGSPLYSASLFWQLAVKVWPGLWTEIMELPWKRQQCVPSLELLWMSFLLSSLCQGYFRNCLGQTSLLMWSSILSGFTLHCGFMGFQGVGAGYHPDWQWRKENWPVSCSCTESHWPSSVFSDWYGSAQHGYVISWNMEKISSRVIFAHVLNWPSCFLLCTL